MIDAKELRIGNLVLYKESKAKISGIGLKHIYAYTFYREANTPTSTENVPLPLEDINPITLNEELLLKCGFESVSDCDSNLTLVLKMPQNEKKRDYQQELVISGFTDEISKYGVSLCLAECDNDLGLPIYSDLQTQATSIPIMYLHQLQNIFFALTGQELEAAL